MANDSRFISDLLSTWLESDKKNRNGISFLAFFFLLLSSFYFRSPFFKKSLNRKIVAGKKNAEKSAELNILC